MNDHLHLKLEWVWLESLSLFITSLLLNNASPKSKAKHIHLISKVNTVINFARLKQNTFFSDYTPFSRGGFQLINQTNQWMIIKNITWNYCLFKKIIKEKIN